MTTHAELGASVAARWMACPGSVRLSRGIPNTESVHSRAGTAAHEVAKLALQKGVDPDMWLGLTVEGVEIDEEMVEAVKVYTTYCTGLMVDNQNWVERKFSLAALNPPGQMFGTADFVNYDCLNRTLEVVDYKNGSGVVVEVKGNKQLRYYALGATLSLEGHQRRIDKVKITVVQPRASHPDGVIRSEVVDYLDLLAFAGELMDAARATLDPDAPLKPGHHCRFCPASAICPAQREQAQAIAQVAFEAMPLDVPPSPEQIPPEMFADILTKLPILEEWAKAMRAHAIRQLEAGESVSGFKLVAKRATRKWISEKQVEDWLFDTSYTQEEIYDRKLKSPAQIEKLVGKKNMQADLYESKSSGYTLATTADKRPALASGASEAFAALPSASE